MAKYPLCKKDQKPLGVIDNISVLWFGSGEMCALVTGTSYQL